MRTGFLQLVPADEAAALRANVAAQQALGIATSAVDAAECARLVPGMLVDDVGAAAWEPCPGTRTRPGRPPGSSRRRGGWGRPTRAGSTCIGVRVAGERVAGVETSAGPLDAPVVVDAAGAVGGGAGARP